MEQRAHSNSQKVAGYCPMGCGQTLFLGDLGGVTCSDLQCPRPDVVHTLLCNPEHEHRLVIADGKAIVKHPLRERADDELFDCPALDLAQQEPDLEEGEYRFRIVHEGGDEEDAGGPVLVDLEPLT